MGQFLATGLVTKITISKDQLTKGKISTDELFNTIEQKLYYNLDIFDIKEKEEYFILKLKETIFQKELLPFLSKLLPIIHGDDAYSREVIINLQKTPSSEWMKLAERKSYDYFQIDEYGENEYLKFDKDFNPTIKINFTSILFAMEGKIIMETYGEQFLFYKYCMIQTFKEFSLASALRTYITG